MENPMKPVQFMLALFATSSFALAQAIDAPGGDDSDLAGGGSAKVVTWEPMIIEFYAAAEHGTSAVIRQKLKNSVLPEGVKSADVLGEVNQWRQLKPAITPRPAGAAGTPAYTDKESVLSAWHRSVDDDARVSFITYGSNSTTTDAKPGEPAPAPGIHTIYSQDHNILFSCDLDILTNANAADKDKMLNYFRISQYQIYAHKVSDDPKRFRDAIPENAQTVRIRAFVENTVITPQYREIAHTYARPKGGFNVDLLLSGMGETGVWEFRVKVVVQGKLTDADPPVTKEAVGAIRVAFVKDKQFDVRILNFDGQRKAGEKDDYIYTADGRKIPVLKTGKQK